MIPFYRILLVEDDPGFAESVMRVFAAFNILLDSATDGRVALIWVRSRPYDAVITDLRMPIVGGF
ncbi:MAG TPA: response regulator, partial [Leptospiraceae bacterium]|nr:response regulator [Leptospiraceae bacterium]